MLMWHDLKAFDLYWQITETKSKNYHPASFKETKSSPIFRKDHSDLEINRVGKGSWDNRCWKVKVGMFEMKLGRMELESTT